MSQGNPGKAPQPNIIAGISAYNEERFIGEVVGKAKKYVNEVVVIDDGSTDDTAELAEAAGAVVIKHRVNQGAGQTTKFIFDVARKRGADILVTLDGDGQHKPDEIPQVLAPILAGRADLVVGSRFIGDHSSMPRYRKFGIDVITWLLNLGAKLKVSDAQSCFRAYSRKALDSLSVTEKGFGFSVQLLIDARQGNLAITEVPISCVYHSDSHSLNPVVHGLGVAITVVRLRLKKSLLQREARP